MDQRKKEEALHYHEFPQPGKIAIVPTKKHSTQHDLALAYSPGVAEPCLAIAEDKSNAYKYTAKSNLVAVISNGTAVLGLGDIGADASKPVMEGKGLLFKIFAGIDVFDIEIDATDVDKFIETVKAIAPTFGGINLEDIKAPEAFEIERRLKEELDIPVMHDDQHGTAIISAAALINALEIVGKDIAKAQIVVNGAGAAAISCTRLYVALGANPKNIVMCDSKGVIRKDSPNLTEQKAEFATDRNLHTLEEAVKGSDVFIGLSKGNVLTPEMLLSMNKDAIVFAMANPTPEIDYDLVINEEMKLAAVHAIAELAKKPVPQKVSLVYGGENLTFGRNYIIPKPFDPRLIYEVPPAIAKAAMASGVAQKPITDWEAYKGELMDRIGVGSKEIRLLQDRAKRAPKRIVFAEADQLEVLKAAQRIYEDGIGIPVLLGNKDMIKALKYEIGFNGRVDVIDPKSDAEKARREKFVQHYWKLRERRGITYEVAERLMRERNYFGTMLVETGQADAMITGYSHAYPKAIRPVLEIIKKEEGVRRVAAASIMFGKQGPLFLSDATININPTAEELANIALLTARAVKFFGLEPSVAMLSYSSFGSAVSESSLKVREAVAYLHKNHPDLVVDGEIQADFALNPDKIAKNYPFSKLNNGKAANVLIFPNLEAANISYKLLKETEHLDTIGPVILGLTKPIHVATLGSTVDEMVNLATLAVIQAQSE